MRPLLDPALEQYAQDHTQPASELMRELVRVTREASAHANMQVGNVEGTFLRMLVAITRARYVLEIGTFTGYSALAMAEALPEGGELVTCDIDPDTSKIAQSFFDRTPHGKKIKIRLGDARDTLRSYPESELFDLVFLDADKASYCDYYDLALPRLKKGGLIVADNTLWSGKVLDPKTVDDIGIDAFNTKITTDPRVDNVLLSVRDGIMLARKL